MAQNDLTRGVKSLPRIVYFGIPLLFGQVMKFLYQIADNAMLGHFGEGSFELAAVGIAGLFTWILNTFLWPLSNGVQAITSRRFGRQDHDSADERAFTGESLDNAIITAVYATVLALAVSFLARPVLSRLLQTREILELALQYISVMRIALLPTGLYFVMTGFFGAINKTSYIMWSGLISNLLNVALDYVLIFGKLGFPAMGIRGAAIGTMISLVAAALYLVAVIIIKGYARQYRLFSFRHLSRRLQADIVRVASAPAVQNVVALSIFMVYQTVIEDYSPVFLAATQAVFSYFRLNKTVIGGFARGAGILAGNALGRGDKQDARTLITASGLVAAAVAVIIALGTYLFRHGIGLMFSNDPATIDAISRTLVFFIPFFFVEALGFAFEMVFITNGYGRYVLISEFSTNVVFILGATLLMRYLFPDDIMFAWLSFGSYQIAHATIMIVGWLRRRWLDVEVDRDSSPDEQAIVTAE